MADRNDNIGTSGRDDSVVNPDSGTDENSGMSGSDRGRSDVSGDELDSDSGSSQSDGQEEGQDSGSSRSGGIGEDNTSNR
jgi:hypothetical protein